MCVCKGECAVSKSRISRFRKWHSCKARYTQYFRLPETKGKTKRKSTSIPRCDSFTELENSDQWRTGCLEPVRCAFAWGSLADNMWSQCLWVFTGDFRGVHCELILSKASSFQFVFQLLPGFLVYFIPYISFLATLPQPLPKWVLHKMRSSAPSFKLQYCLFSIRLFSRYSRLLPHFLVPSIFNSISCFRRELLRKMWPKKHRSFFLLYVGCLFPAWLFVILLDVPHSRSSWFPSFSSNTFQIFKGTSDLYFKDFSFQCHKKLLSKYSISLVYSLNVSPIFWWKDFSGWMPLLPWQSWI